MPELYKSIIGSVVRFALTGLFGWFVSKGVVTEGQSAELIIAIAGGVVVLGWSLYQKYKEKLKFFTALEVPVNAGPAKVDAVIAQTDTADNVAKAFQ
jgi:hypothetical protein